MPFTYITSDLHFNHKKIIDFQPNRKKSLNCETIEEMNENLIKYWNETVKPEDTIYHLGDFSFTSPKDILPRLNGEIIFILGNHDYKLHYPFLNTFRYLEIKYNNKDIILFHFPIRYWNKSDEGSIHFHGHTHGHYDNFGKSIDVGFDAHDKFLTMEEAIEIADKKNIDSRMYR